jgi:hypothetical protein
MAETTWTYDIQDYSPLVKYAATTTTNPPIIPNLPSAWQQSCPLGTDAQVSNSTICDLSSVHTSSFNGASVTIDFFGKFPSHHTKPPLNLGICREGYPIIWWGPRRNVLSYYPRWRFSKTRHRDGILTRELDELGPGSAHRDGFSWVRIRIRSIVVLQGCHG